MDARVNNKILINGKCPERSISLRDAQILEHLRHLSGSIGRDRLEHGYGIGQVECWLRWCDRLRGFQSINLGLPIVDLMYQVGNRVIAGLEFPTWKWFLIN